MLVIGKVASLLEQVIMGCFLVSQVGNGLRDSISMSLEQRRFLLFEPTHGLWSTLPEGQVRCQRQVFGDMIPVNDLMGVVEIGSHQVPNPTGSITDDLLE